MFGMGTGGSLRLLSPEIWGCLGRALPLCLPLRSGFASRSFGSLHFAPLPIRSALASLSLAPSKPHRFAFAQLRPTKTSLRYSLRHSRFAFPARFSRALPASLLFPTNHLPGSGSVPSSQVPLPLLLFPVHSPLFPSLQDQALDRLVSSSSIHCCTSTDDLSTLSSSRGLTCF